MDEGDEAQRLEEMERTRGLAAVRAALPRGEGRADCVGCGAPIPPARRRALQGTVRCVDCAEAIERRRRVVREAFS